MILLWGEEYSGYKLIGLVQLIVRYVSHVNITASHS